MNQLHLKHSGIHRGVWVCVGLLPSADRRQTTAGDKREKQPFTLRDRLAKTARQRTPFLPRCCWGSPQRWRGRGMTLRSPDQLANSGGKGRLSSYADAWEVPSSDKGRKCLPALMGRNCALCWLSELAKGMFPPQ